MTPKVRRGFVCTLVLLACDEPTPPSRVGGFELRLVTPPGSVAVFDSGRIHVQGQRDTVLMPGHSVTYTGLPAGVTYTIAVEGFVDSTVENYGEGSVTIQANTNRTASIAFPTFIPNIIALPSSGSSLSFDVSFSSVTFAVTYEVQASTDNQFPSGSTMSKTSASTTVTMTVPSYGTYYVRVRAIDRYPGGRGTPSGPLQSIALAPPPSISISPPVLTFQPTGPGTIGQPANVTNPGGGSVDGLSVAAIHYVPGQAMNWLTAQLVGTSAPTQLNVNATAGSTPEGKDTAYVVLTSTTSGVPAESLLAQLIVNTRADHLQFTSQPTTTVAGQSIASFQVTAKDASNATVTSFSGPISVTITSGTGKPGAALISSTPVTPVSGVATFTGLSIDSAGTAYTLDASAPVSGGTSTIQSAAPSSPFNITPAAATHLVFSTQPSGGQANATLAPVQVTAKDALGNVATGFSGNVTISITSGTGTSGATLSGSTTVAAISGVASFTTLSVDKVGTGYTFTSSATGLTSAVSNAFNIITGAVSATNSSVIANPPSIAVNTGLSTITVTAKDGGGNPIQGATVFLSATGSGNTLTQPTTVTDAQGITTGTLASSVAESKTVTATASSVTITQQATVTVTSCSNCWVAKAPMPTARTGLGVGAINGKLYAVGGYNGTYLDTLEAYDTTSNSWTTLKSMPTARRRLAVGVINGKLYAVGGFNGSYLATLEVYDPSTNLWKSLKPMTVPRHRLAVAVANGKLYAIGGENTSGSLTTVERYDTAMDSWTMVDTLSTARYGLGVDSTNGAVYAVGGYNGSYPRPIERYDFTSWTTLSATFQMTAGRSGMGVGVINGLLYVVGGYNGSFLTTVEVLDPATGWTSKQSLPSARAGLAAGVINGKLYAVGGDTGGAAFARLEVFTP